MPALLRAQSRRQDRVRGSKALPILWHRRACAQSHPSSSAIDLEIFAFAPPKTGKLLTQCLDVSDSGGISFPPRQKKAPRARPRPVPIKASPGGRKPTRARARERRGAFPVRPLSATVV